jgi:SAM-dependent methyltransferase
MIESGAGSAPTIEDVRRFWDDNPLWTGETDLVAGTMAFFEEQKRVCYEDGFAGSLDETILPKLSPDARILDLGCGIGFWLVEFWDRGFRQLTGADLSSASLKIARQRCEIYGVQAELRMENAEALTFDDASFDHVNCQGVIHHTPDTQKAVDEIARVLRPGGTASLSVYYRNLALRNWWSLRPFGRAVAAFGARLKGRGREDIYKKAEVDDIIRLFDGAANPVGKAYSVSEFRRMVESHFEVERVFFHFFPARSLPVVVPRALHRFLDRHMPFMVYLNLRKVC